MVVFLQEQGYTVDRKRVRRLMELMGLETIYPKPRVSLPGEQPVRSPYLLRDMSIDRIDQVWSCDITSIRLARGFVYLMAIIDWFSRFVLAWELSVTPDTHFCLEALERDLWGNLIKEPESLLRCRKLIQQRLLCLLLEQFCKSFSPCQGIRMLASDQAFGRAG